MQYNPRWKDVVVRHGFFVPSSGSLFEVPPERYFGQGFSTEKCRHLRQELHKSVMIHTPLGKSQPLIF
jgi:hypothetical protein